jgi:hypothetical protein
MYSSQENYEKVYAKRFIQSSQFCQSSYLANRSCPVSEVAKKIRCSSHRHAGKDRQKVGAGFKPALTTQF